MVMVGSVGADATMRKKSLEELYGITKKDVKLTRVKTKSGKWLEYFKNPSGEELLRVEIEFPEFTCLCPRTGHPDFANITLKYVPDKRCVELKALKYFYNSFRDEGHFHEQVISTIYTDLEEVLKPAYLMVVGDFAVRGGTYPRVTRGKWIMEQGSGKGV